MRRSVVDNSRTVGVFVPDLARVNDGKLDWGGKYDSH